MNAVVDTAFVRRWVERFAGDVAAAREELTALDAAIGDADHGTNLDRGMTAVLAALPAGGPPSALLKGVGMTLVSTVGGASGPLYGTFFLRLASALGKAETLDPPAFAAAFHAAVEGVTSRGRAAADDKTMLDALLPAADALSAAAGAGRSLADCLQAAAEAAAEGRDATVPMVARKGRASYLGERSAGHPDPGATSATLLLTAAARAATP